MSSNANFTANGTIYPSRFVTIDPTSQNRVIQASGTSQPLAGISQEWSKLAPTPGATQEAADQGDQLAVYQVGDVAFLQSTASGWTAGDRLTSDANGNGITASSTNNFGAVALETLSVAALGRVNVVQYTDF